MTLSSEISITSKFTEKSFLVFANNCQQSKDFNMCIILFWAVYCFIVSICSIKMY